jgi:hypothetical protein
MVRMHLMVVWELTMPMHIPQANILVYLREVEEDIISETNCEFDEINANNYFDDIDHAPHDNIDMRKNDHMRHVDMREHGIRIHGCTLDFG